MGTRYYELILSGRQLALLAACVVGLITVAFVLGIGVGLQEPVPVEPTPITYVSSDVPAPSPALVPPTERAQPAVEPAAPSSLTSQLPAAEPVLPSAEDGTPTPASEQIAAPTPTATPRPTPHQAPEAPKASHWVQVAALSREELAEGVRQRIVALGFRPEQVVVRPAGGSYRVRLGPFPDEASSRRVVSRLRAQGFADAFPVTE